MYEKFQSALHRQRAFLTPSIPVMLMFYERLTEVTKQMEVLQQTMNTIKYKCWYYDTALADGTEEKVKNLPVEEIPEELREHKI